MQKVQLMLLECRFGNWLVSKAIGLNSFDNISIEMLLVKFGVCVKIICCLFAQFFRHVDGKNRSAIAPLVFLCGKKYSKTPHEITATSYKNFHHVPDFFKFWPKFLLLHSSCQSITEDESEFKTRTFSKILFRKRISFRVGLEPSTCYSRRSRSTHCKLNKYIFPLKLFFNN